MEGGKKGVNTNAFARQFLQVGLFCHRDILEVAAHEPNKRSPYVAIRLREHQEGQASRSGMGDHIACLRGWHPALAHAELVALLPQASILPTACLRWYSIEKASEQSRQEALAIASGLQCFLRAGVIVDTTCVDEIEWLTQMKHYLVHHPVKGSVAVRYWKQGTKIPHWSLSSLARTLGGAFSECGYPVNLESPEHVFAIISDAESQTLACGWMEGDGMAPFSNGERRAGERPFFKPVSLDPMLARAAVNIATGPRDSGPVVDPMTGTGGFLIEAALSGREAFGLDINSEMVEGANRNLSWAMNGQSTAGCSLVRGDATRLRDTLPQHWLGNVAGFVLDPPYGRNSQGSMDAFALIEACLVSARNVAAEHAGFVLILPIHPLTNHSSKKLEIEENIRMLYGEWREMPEMLSRCGWQLQSIFAERVHRSLSRLILHSRCVPQD